MVTGGNQRRSDDGDHGKGNFSKVPSSGKNSLGTTAFTGSHSATTSGSVGSPSSRSEHAPAATPVSDCHFVRRLNHVDINEDEAGSAQGAPSGKNRKRETRSIAGDKSRRGLRQFSMKVCEKVESKGRTTYNEVADELVAECIGSSCYVESQDQYDEKNIRRRVYDALNVLMAMDIISKDKKEIQWKGLPRTNLNDIEDLKAEHSSLRSRIYKKTAYLQELQDQIIGLQNLIQRNEQLDGSGNASSGGVALPFIIVQTHPHVTVEVEISEDMQLVHFDFNSTPFELHDDTFVLKAMRFCERQQNDGCAHEFSSNGGEISSTLHTYPPLLQQASRPSPSSVGKLLTSPIPGILKARV